MPLRIFADPTVYKESERKQVVDLCKAHWNQRSHAERIAVSGRSLIEDFALVARPEDADLCFLTMRWNWYVDNRAVDTARREVAAARRAGKPTVAFSLGDFTAHLPFPDVHVFECSSYRSRRGRTVHAAPPFFADTAATWYGGKPPLRPYTPRPTISFCGQAGGTARDFLERRVKNLARRVAYRAGLLRWEPTPFEHTILRKRVLDTFAASSAVECRFVIRDQYRAGLEHVDKGDSSRQQSEKEFVENLAGGDYTICVRGGGNYSKRFYEALCLGRIPVLIDTDCLLPYDEQVDWSRFCVTVDASELERAPEAVAAYHARFTPATWAERQRECRKLWQERLTPDGFYAHFHEHFASFATR